MFFKFSEYSIKYYTDNLYTLISYIISIIDRRAIRRLLLRRGRLKGGELKGGELRRGELRGVIIGSTYINTILNKISNKSKGDNNI